MFGMYLIQLILDFVMWHNIIVALLDRGRTDEAQQHRQDKAGVGERESHKNEIRRQVVLPHKFEVATK